MDATQNSGPRREVATRNTRWASRIAAWLAQAGVRPNAISVASAVFAAIGGVCIVLSATMTSWLHALLLIVAIVMIQGRLLCNLFDGMVAVEGGMKTKSGELFNDVPDRLSDSFILVSAGYAAHSIPWGVDLGWLAALLAALTAYVRMLGGAAGAKQYFLGPMAKQHRMAVMSVALLAAAVLSAYAGWILAGALALIAAGCMWTLARRVRAIFTELESAA